jgi:hypothetical protein
MRQGHPNHGFAQVDEAERRGQRRALRHQVQETQLRSVLRIRGTRPSNDRGSGNSPVSNSPLRVKPTSPDLGSIDREASSVTSRSSGSRSRCPMAPLHLPVPAHQSVLRRWRCDSGHRAQYRTVTQPDSAHFVRCQEASIARRVRQLFKTRREHSLVSRHDGSKTLVWHRRDLNVLSIIRTDNWIINFYGSLLHCSIDFPTRA